MVKKLQKYYQGTCHRQPEHLLLPDPDVRIQVTAGAFTVNGLRCNKETSFQVICRVFLQLFGNQSVNSGEMFSLGLIENLKNDRSALGPWSYCHRHSIHLYDH